VAAAGLDTLPRRLAALVASSIAVQAAIIVQGATLRSRTVAWIAGLAVLAGYQPLFWVRYGATRECSSSDTLPTRWVGLGPARAIGARLAMVASACRSALASPGRPGTPAASPARPDRRNRVVAARQAPSSVE